MSHTLPPLQGDRRPRSSAPAVGALIVASCLIAGCQAPRPVYGGSAAAPSSRPAPVPAASIAASQRAQLASSPAATLTTAPSVPALAGSSALGVPALYACIRDRGGVRQVSAIEFEPKVEALCRRHPEMGPCQYQRQACRREGGRVYAEGGVEITLETEAAYDRQVLRRTFRSN